MQRALLAIVLVLGCGKGKEKAEPIMISDAVEAGRKDIAEVVEALAAKNTNRASAICSVAKPGLPTLKKADSGLADQLTKLCTRDQPMLEMQLAIEKIEANKKPDVTGLHIECASRKTYEKWIDKGGYQADPDVVALEARWDAACPAKKP